MEKEDEVPNHSILMTFKREGNMSNKTLLGVGLMITGAILYNGSLLRDTLVSLSSNTTLLDVNLLRPVSGLSIIIGLCVAVYGLKK